MEHILGQQRAIDVLQAAFASDRLHHAYIFHGPRGVGKFTTAKAFAKLLLCPNRQADLAGRVEACGTCESCRMMVAPPPDKDNPYDNEPHPDYHVIRKELAGVSSVTQLRSRKQMNIPIDLLRERMIGGTTADDRFHEAVAYKTAQLRHNKVFIIDEAELLDSTGQNSLLKTLEEPPAGTYIVLVTSNEDLLLPTIRSRSQRVAFAPLPDDIVAQWIGQQEGAPTGKAREWLVHFAGGSIGLAQLAIDNRLVEWAKVVLPALDGMNQGEYPASLGSDIAGMINTFAESWVDAHANASKDAANRMAAGLMWTLISQRARQRIAEQAEKCAPGDPLAADAALEPWLGVIDALADAERELGSNVNMGLVTDALVAAMYRTLSPAGVA